MIEYGRIYKMKKLLGIVVLGLLCKINWMWRKKRKEHRIFDRIMLAVFLLIAFIYTVKFLMGFFLKLAKQFWNYEKTFKDRGSGFVRK